jgi:hypothetical protein
MEEVYQQYRQHGFEFFYVYVREAHPGEKITAHKSFEEKVANACRLKDEEGVTIPILVDTLDGEVHQRYGASDGSNSTCPRLMVVDKEGRIVFKSTWADANELRVALDALRERERLLAEGFDLKEARIEKFHFPLRDLPERQRVLSRAGEESIRDWKVVYGEIKEF